MFGFPELKGHLDEHKSSEVICCIKRQMAENLTQCTQARASFSRNYSCPVN